MEKDNKELPYDFWNYNINPIVGYKIENREENGKKVERKYAKIPQTIKTNDS
jgi:hypothetical protein